jgi:hypothetical protein
VAAAWQSPPGSRESCAGEAVAADDGGLWSDVEVDPVSTIAQLTPVPSTPTPVSQVSVRKERWL